MNKTAAVMFAFLSVFWIAPAMAESKPATSGSAVEQPKSPGIEVAPGFEDFEKGNVNPEDVQEQQEREEDRNVISPSMQDGEPLPGMDADMTGQ